MKIGILRETKTPPDTRVPLTPAQCRAIMDAHDDVLIVVQPAEKRCYRDEEYRRAGVELQARLEDCDVLMGVKEVAIESLIQDKTYFFFSHTIKKQPYNRRLLQEVVKRHIRLIDYEVLTDDKGRRVIAFGRWAGIVGAHNTVHTWGKRTGRYDLPRMVHGADFAEARAHYGMIDVRDLRIVVTGTGRVSHGAAEVLDHAGLERVAPSAFLKSPSKDGVYTMLEPKHMFADADGSWSPAFFDDPSGYHSIVRPYAESANVLINGIFWDNRGPALLTREDMLAGVTLDVIGDITCDIAPDASLPSTIRPSTIAAPIYGYDPVRNAEAPPHEDGVVDVMAVDNLPNELPRDASQDFGEQFMAQVLNELLMPETSDMLHRATIARNGSLNEPFAYLDDYIHPTD